jgi:hypothetical protein
MKLTERECITLYSAVLEGLPRRTLRFINTYWILKGGLDPRARAQLEQSDFRCVIALLAIAIVAEDQFPKISEIVQSSAKRKQFSTLLTEMSFLDTQLQAKLTKSFKGEADLEVAILAKYAGLVARYSFHAGLKQP